MAGERVTGQRLTTGSKASGAGKAQAAAAKAVRQAQQKTRKRNPSPAQRELNQLRDQVRKSERLAQRKVNRLQRSGVRIEGSKLDPVRDTPVERLTRKQLESYADKLEKFRDRGTQYVPDAHGRPMPKSEWDAYKRAERRANRIKGSALDQIKDIFVEPQGMTVEQRRAIRETILHLDQATNDPYRQVHRKPQDVNSLKALRKLRDHQQAIGLPDYEYKRLKTARKTINKMLKDAGADKSFAAKVKTLSTDELNLLWNGTNFADRLSHWYINMKNQSSAQKATAGTELAVAQEILDWVINRRKK